MCKMKRFLNEINGWLDTLEEKKKKKINEINEPEDKI